MDGMGIISILMAEALEDYFSSAIEADNLFVEDKYIHGGYYEYSSLKNGAVFDETTGNFTLYAGTAGSTAKLYRRKTKLCPLIKLLLNSI